MFRTICYNPADMEVVDTVSDLVATKDFGDYVVDDSHFIPMSEAVKRVTGGTLSAQEVKVMYDFPNGKDTGKKVPVDRSHRVNDIAEMSVEARKVAKNVEEGLKEAQAQYEYEKTLAEVQGTTTDNNAASGK